MAGEGMYRICKRFTFEAAHVCSSGVRGVGSCAGVHGHSYVADLVLEAGDLIPPGFVVDFADLAPFKAYVDDMLDHRVVNDVIAAPATHRAVAEHLRAWCEKALHLRGGVQVYGVFVRAGRTAKGGLGTGWSRPVQFEAAHQLAGLPLGHKCVRLHGHSYQARVQVPMPAERHLWASWSNTAERIRVRLGGQRLNDVMSEEPTSENLARLVHDWFIDDARVTPASANLITARVSETALTWAEYRPGALA